MEQIRIDEIARRLLDSVPPALRSMQQDLETNFRAVLRSSLGKLDLVTRDEFDTQTKVLERTRAKLEETKDPDEAIEILSELAEIAKEVEAQLQQAKRAAES